MNARAERPGWDQWGNEVGKFEQPGHGVIVTESQPFQPPLFAVARPKFIMSPGLDDIDPAPESAPFLRLRTR